MPKVLQSIPEFFKGTSFFFKEHGEAIRVVALLVAGLFILNEYLATQRAAREVRALDYVFRAHQPEILAARMQTEMAPIYPPMNVFSSKLWGDGPVETVIEEVADFRKELCERSTELCPPLESIQDQQLDHIQDDDDLRMNTHRVAAFYGSVSLCALTEKCDPKVLCQVFFGEIQMFYFRHYGYLKHMDQNWNIARLFYITRFIEMCKRDEHLV